MILSKSGKDYHVCVLIAAPTHVDACTFKGNENIYQLLVVLTAHLQAEMFHNTPNSMYIYNYYNIIFSYFWLVAS